MPVLPKRPSRFRPKQLILVAVILLMVAGLALAALVLNGRNKQAAKDADGLGSYRVVENPIVASNASFASDAPDRNVTINGDLFLNGRLKLSAEANTDLTDILGRKVSLVPALNGVQQAGNISITGTVLANNFQGNGANLSNLNASAVTSGTLSIDRLDPSVTRLGQTIPLTALQSTVLSTLNGIGGNTDRNVDIVGSGNIVVTTDADTNQIVLSSLAGGGDITGVIAGTGLTGGGLVGDVTLNIDTGTVTVQGNTFNGVDQLVKLNGAGELPVISATNLTNLNASNVTTGSLSDTRLSANVTLQGNTFNLANKLVKLDGSGNLPALNGSAVTNLSAGNISTGTVADARLSANVALLNATQTFLGNVTFSQPLSVNVIQPSSTMIIGATNQSLTLQGDMSTALVANDGVNSVSLGFTGTPTGDIVYNLDASTTPGNYTLCTTVGNCANAGGGVTTLGGTTNKLTKFTGGQSIGDSSITDAGTLVTVASNGLFKASADSTTAFRVQKAATSANVFTVDTTNSRVAIGQNTANYPLDVAGDINSSTGLRVGGNLVCDSSGCAASNGSGFYIQNGTNVQTAANLNIESASTTSPTIALKAKSGQTSNLFEASNSSGSPVATIDTAGNVNTVGQFKVNGAQIASSNLSNDANLAKLNGTQTFTGTDTFKNASDSTAGFQVQNASGAGVIVADTSNKRVAIGQDTAGYTLDVNGDVNITGGSSYRINGVAICGPLATCAPSSGSSSYVQNGLVKQTANFNVQSSNASAIGGIVQGAVGQTADVFQARNSNDDVIAKITASGAIYQGANQVCDASNNCGYVTSAAGAGNYIQNGTGSQTANMNIKSASASSVTSNIQGASGQTANILQVTDGTTQGNSIVSVNQTTPNLIENSSFETNLSGWTSSGSTTNTQVTNEAYSGNASLQMNSTAVSSKAIFSYPLASSTQYSFSFYAKSATSSNAQMGVAYDGVTENNCGSIVITAVWTRYTCTFTTTTTSGTPNVYLKQVSTGARILYIDAVQLELGSTATNYSLGNIGLNGTVNSPTIFQNQSNSMNAFQIQNAAGEQLLNVDTNSTNLITNSSFEINTAGWVGKNAATIARNTTQRYNGNASLALTTTTAVADAASFPYALLPSTTYSLSFNFKRLGNQGLAAGYSIDGTTDTYCLNNGNTTITHWTRQTCTFTTGASVTGSPYIFIKGYQPGAAETIYIDAVQLEVAAAASPYQQSAYSLNGVITSAVSLRNQSDSTTALAIQNAAGTPQFAFNTATGTLCAGASCNTTNGGNSVQLVAGSGLKLEGASPGFFPGSFLRSGDGATLSVSTDGSGETFGLNTSASNIARIQGNSSTINRTGLTVVGAAGQAADVMQVQGGNTSSSILSVAQNNSNLISNPSFDTATTGWAITAGGASLSRITTNQYSGAGSMRNTNTATANTGGRFNYQLVANSTYTFSMYAKAEGSNFATFEMGYNTDGTTYTSCLTAQTVTTATWTRYTCTFTMPSSVSSTRFVYFRQTDATARSFLIDAVQLEATSVATNYSLGNIGLNGVINSPTIFQNQSDSSNAFQIQNAASDRILSVDTATTNLLANSSFESALTGWSAKGSATLTRSSTQKMYGDSSLGITYTSTSGDGATLAYPLASSTTYTLSMYVYVTSIGQYGGLIYSNDGVTPTVCTNITSIINTWARATCTFTTGTVSGTPYIGFAKNYTGAGTAYIDGVQLEAGSNSNPYRIGGISLNGVISSQATFKNQENSTTGFQVQNASGGTVLVADTVNNRVCIPSCQLGATGQTIDSTGINFTSVANNTTKISQTNAGLTFGQGSGNYGGVIFNGAANYASPIINVQSGQNSSSIVSVSQNNANLITNPSFDTDTTGWANFTGATLSRIITDQYSGQSSLSVVNTATAGAGAKINYNLAASTTYSFSLYAKATGSNFATFQIGYSADGATNTSCLTAQTVTTTGWTRYTCTFTTTTVSGTRYVYFAQTDGTARTFYVDAVQLEAAAAPTNYNVGNISLNGTITSPTTFQNQSNSNNAFTVQNTAGTNILAVDTVNNTVKATSVLGAQNNQLNLGSTGTQQQFNVGSISQFGTVNFMDTSQNNQVLTVNSTSTGVNLIGLGSNFSTGTAGFGTDGAAAITRSTVDQYSGAGSLRVVTSAAANDGVKLMSAWVTGGIANSTTYTLSVYAKASGSNFSTFQMGYTNDGTTYISCLTGQTVTTTAWQRYTCTFTTSASSPGRFIYFRQTDATARTFYIDAVQLEAGSVATGYSEGTITANGIFNSPAVFKNGSDSTTAFQIQNAAGTNLLTANTAGSALTVGAGLQVADTGVAKQSAGNLAIGTSVNGGNINISAAQGFGTTISGLTGGAAIDVLRVGSENTANISNTSGTATGINVNPSFQPATGTGNFVGVNINPTINQTGSATGDYTALQIRPNVTAATGTNKLLIDAGTVLNTGQLTMTDTGQFKLKNATDSTSAFQVQNSSGVAALVVDSTNMKVTVKDLAITGHIISGGTTPGIAAGPAAGTSPSLSITGTDTAGTITLTTGTSPAAGAVAVTVNFASNFASAPVVVFSPTNPGASSLSGASAVYVTPGTSSFTLSTWSGGLTASTLYQWSYHVIQ